MRIALLSDTHLPSGLRDLDALGPESAAFLASCDLILHGGDVVLPEVLDWCAQFAPVQCAGGGHDHFEDPRMRPVQRLVVHGWRIGMVHDIEAIPPSIRTVDDLKREVYGDPDLDVLLSGDSHFERLEYRDGTLLMDSGSPIFAHHRSARLGSMGLLDVQPDGLRAEIVPLGETPDLPNPTTAAAFVIDGAGLVSATVAGEPLEVDGREHVGFRPNAAPPLRV